MLEKPNIPKELIIARAQEGYDLFVAELTFLPIGADLRTAVYRLISDDGISYFLKLRKKFHEVIVRAPVFLHQHGVQEVMIPYPTKSKQYWADFGDYKIILYPFVEGKNGFEVDLTDQQKQTLGAALKRIHSIQVPPELRQLIRKESFNLGWRESMREYQAQAETDTFMEPTAAKLAEFIRSKQSEITRLVERSQQLASQLQPEKLDPVLCHSDFHGGNILISDIGELYIVDWDDPMLAPKERDLMFIGSAIDDLWESQRDIDLFYRGYGKTKVNRPALAYYRYERVIEDLAVICDQLLLSDEGGADREQAYRWFTSNFEPGSTIEIAERTDA